MIRRLIHGKYRKMKIRPKKPSIGPPYPLCQIDFVKVLQHHPSSSQVILLQLLVLP
jgi:hypothetical protein